MEYLIGGIAFVVLMIILYLIFNDPAENAMEKGDLVKFKKAIKKKRKEEKKNELLLLTCEEDKLEFMKALLDNGYSISPHSVSHKLIIILVNKTKNFEMFKLLVEHDLNHMAVIYYLCGEGDKFISWVKELLNKGCDINLIDNPEEEMIIGVLHTPLHSACGARYDCHKLVNYLLEKGADPDITDKRDTTPLMKACRHRKLPVMKLLLEAGADPHAINSCGQNAYHFLLEQEGYINATLTLDMVKLLHEYGTNPHLVDRWKKTPLDYAKNRYPKEITDYVKNIPKPQIKNDKKEDEKTINLPISKYSEFYCSLFNKFGIDDAEILYSKFKVNCNSCGHLYTKMELFSIDLYNETQRDMSSLLGAKDKCPKCESETMKIQFI